MHLDSPSDHAARLHVLDAGCLCSLEIVFTQVPRQIAEAIGGGSVCGRRICGGPKRRSDRCGAHIRATTTAAAARVDASGVVVAAAAAAAAAPTGAAAAATGAIRKESVIATATKTTSGWCICSRPGSCRWELGRRVVGCLTLTSKTTGRAIAAATALASVGASTREVALRASLAACSSRKAGVATIGIVATVGGATTTTTTT